MPRPAPREVLSLDDVTLQVPAGQAVAVIGANGAGKTTLLRILARITEPTLGVSRTRGRVAALLEVGAGFHPELTGRENAYLAGALYGLRRREVSDRLDEIVAFAGVAPLLDTPVKRYSSGQYLRLAFAVAAHLEPDILLIDEVLAVGDAEFQQRCLGALRAAGDGGRTVVFVSHDLDAVSHLCSRVVWLHEGRVRADGPAAETIAAYLDAVAASAAERVFADDASGPVSLLRARAANEGGGGGALRREAPLELEIEFAVHEPVPALNLALFLTRGDGVRVIDEAWRPGLAATETVAPGTYRATMRVPPILHTGGVRDGRLDRHRVRRPGGRGGGARVHARGPRRASREPRREPRFGDLGHLRLRPLKPRPENADGGGMGDELIGATQGDPVAAAT